MPIRMTDDPVDPNQRDDDGGGGGRGPNLPGGGGGIASLLPLLLGLFKGKGIFITGPGGRGFFPSQPRWRLQSGRCDQEIFWKRL